MNQPTDANELQAKFTSLFGRFKRRTNSKGTPAQFQLIADAFQAASIPRKQKCLDFLELVYSNKKCKSNVIDTAFTGLFDCVPQVLFERARRSDKLQEFVDELEECHTMDGEFLRNPQGHQFPNQWSYNRTFVEVIPNNQSPNSKITSIRQVQVSVPVGSCGKCYKCGPLGDFCR